MIRSILLYLGVLFISVAFSSEIMAAPYTGGNALSFNNSEYDSIPNSQSLSPSQLTIECWVKFKPLFTLISQHYLIDKSSGAVSAGYYRLSEYQPYKSTVTGLSFEIKDRNADPKKQTFTYTYCDTLKILSDIWYHIAGTYDGNWLRLYVNGNMVSDKKVGVIVLGNEQPLKLGMVSGSMDEVRIWSVARTQDEIRSTMHGEIDSAPGLISAWHFDEGTGQTITDATGLNNGYIGSTPNSDNNDPQWIQSTAPVTPNVMVLSPNGGEGWQTDTLQTINWFAWNTTKINIDCSPDAGATWKTVASQVDASSGSYSWTVPNEPSTQGLIRITDSLNPEHTDVSDSLFSLISPFVRVLSPNGGEKWETETTQNITWKSLGVDKIAIEYSIDNGINWTPVASEVSAISDSFAWRVPFTPTSQGRVRIRNSDSSLVSVSESPFSIVQSSITLLHPKGGETLEPGTVEDITWTFSPGVNGADSVRIEYSPNGGSTWQLLTITNAGSNYYRWHVPTEETSQGRMRVTLITHQDVFALTDGSFYIRTETPVEWTYYPSASLVKLLEVNSNAIWYTTETNILRLNRKTAVIDTIIPPPFTQSSIVALELDSKGVAWFGIGGGNYTQRTLLSFDGVSWDNNPVNDLTGLGIDLKDVKYVTTDLVGRDSENYSLQSFYGFIWKTISSGSGSSYFSSHYTSILAVDNSRHSVWIGNTRGPVEILIDTGRTGISGNDESFQGWSINPQEGVLDAHGAFWFASTNGYISTYTNGNWIHFSSQNSPIPWKADVEANHGITITPDNVKWFGGPGGLVRYDGSNWKIIPVSADSTKNSIWSLKVDTDGNIWGITPDGIASYGYIPGPSSVNEKSEEPVAFGTITNYPNPFNPSTTIEFTIPSSGKANLIIYDIMGRKVRELVSGQVSAGIRNVLWDGRDDSGRSVSSGVYIARLTMGKYEAVRKMLMMK